MSKIIDAALTEYVKGSILPLLTAEVKREIDLCNTSLYYGPVYLNDIGEMCSMWDPEYSRPHDFSKGCKVIGDALDALEAVSDLYIDEDGFVGGCEPEGEEVETEDGETEWCPPVPYCRIERKQVVAEAVGRELASYL